MVPSTHSRRAVAIVTGGASQTGRDVACGLASPAWSIVVVYLDDQRRAEATVADIIAAEGTTVAVRADLADDLDVERLFAESIAAFGAVDVVVHTTTECAGLLWRHAARHLRHGGAFISVCAREPIPPAIALQLRERGIAVLFAPRGDVPPFLDAWRRRVSGLVPGGSSRVDGRLPSGGWGSSAGRPSA